MSEYKMTFSATVKRNSNYGIIQNVTPEPPSGVGWSLTDTYFSEDISQFIWTWKRSEVSTSILPVLIDNYVTTRKTYSADYEDYKEIDKKDDETVLIAVRLKPGAGGILLAPTEFGAAQSQDKNSIIRLCIGDHPGGSWSDYSPLVQLNSSPSSLPSNRTRVQTMYIGKDNRVLSKSVGSIKLTDSNQSVFITATTIKNDIDVIAFLTWMEE